MSGCIKAWATAPQPKCITPNVRWAVEMWKTFRRLTGLPHSNSRYYDDRNVMSITLFSPTRGLDKGAKYNQ